MARSLATSAPNAPAAMSELSRISAPCQRRPAIPPAVWLATARDQVPARQPVRIEQGLVVALATIAQQADDAAALAARAHARGQLQAGDEVGARGAAVATTEQFLAAATPRRSMPHPVTSMTASTISNRNPGSTRGRPMPSISVGWRRARIAIARAPAVRRTRCRSGSATHRPRAQAAVAQVAADRRRGAAGAGAADDPRRFRIGFLRQLAEDRFGDVVVAAPVGRAFGQAELVEVAGAARGMPGARARARRPDRRPGRSGRRAPARRRSCAARCRPASPRRMAARAGARTTLRRSRCCPTRHRPRSGLRAGGRCTARTGTATAPAGA